MVCHTIYCSLCITHSSRNETKICFQLFFSVQHTQQLFLNELNINKHTSLQWLSSEKNVYLYSEFILGHRQ